MIVDNITLVDSQNVQGSNEIPHISVENEEPNDENGGTPAKVPKFTDDQESSVNKNNDVNIRQKMCRCNATTKVSYVMLVLFRNSQ